MFWAYLAGNHVVGKITVGANLQGTKNGNINVAAADHGETLGAVEDAGALDEGHGLLAGIDDVAVELGLGRVSTHTENAVLTLDPNLAVFGQERRGESGHADAEVHVEALVELLGGALGDAVAAGGGGRLVLGGFGGGWLAQILGLDDLVVSGFDDTVDVDSGEVDVIRSDGSRGNDVLGFDDGDFGGFGHHRGEVLGRVTKADVAVLVDGVGAQDGDVALDGALHVVDAAVKDAGFPGLGGLDDHALVEPDGDLAALDESVDAGGSVEGRDSSTAAAELLSDGALGCEFDADFAVEIHAFESLVAAEETADGAADLAGFDQRRETAADGCAGIVRDCSERVEAFLSPTCQGADESLCGTAKSKASGEDGRAGLDVRDSLVGGVEDF
jgi:hypothetical protein